MSPTEHLGSASPSEPEDPGAWLREFVTVPPDDTERPATDLARVNALLRRLSRLWAAGERLQQWAERQAASIGWQVKEAEREIAAYARRFKDETGTGRLPVVGGTVTVTRYQVATHRDEDKLAAYAETKGLAGNPAYQTTKWRYGEIISTLKFHPPDEHGVAVAYDPQTGEVVDGVVQIHQPWLSVSIKPDPLPLREEEAAADELELPGGEETPG